MNPLFKTIAYLTTSIILLAATQSCKKMEFDKIAGVAWNPNLAVPLAYSTFGVYDILALQDSNDLIVTNPTTGELALVYKGDIYSANAQSVIQIPDQTENFDLSPSELSLLPNLAFTGTISTNNSHTIDFGINAGVELHTLRFKNGNLSVNVSTSLKQDVTVVVRFPSILINGTPLTRTVNLIYAGFVPQTANIQINLQNALADFTLNNTTFNKFILETDVTITGTGESMTGTEGINLDFGFTNLDFKNATGYFGQQVLPNANDSILIRLFENSIDGYFELKNPRVNFIVENSFGYPARLNLSNLKTININTGQELPLTGYPAVINLNAPTQMGQTAITSLELNSTNTGNINSILTSVPKYFYYEVNGLTNPAGQTSTLNFIEDTSEIHIKAEMELPLEGLAYGFELKDTVDFNLGTDIDKIDFVLFRLISDNGFPVEVAARLKFMDENYNVLFTIFNTPENLIESALVGADGRVNKHSKKTLDITLNEAQLALLSNVKYLELNGIAQTLDAQSGEIVKLYDDYTLYLKLAMQIIGKTTL